MERLQLPGPLRAESRYLAHGFGERLDRYILAKFAGLRRTDRGHGRCDISGACEQLRQFTEALTNWYVRRSRTVLGGGRRRHRHPTHGARGHGPPGGAAAAADHRGDLARAHRRAVGAPDRLAQLELPRDPDLVAAMDQVREVARRGRRCARPRSCAYGCRCRNSLWPWRSGAVRPFADLIGDELNVKAVELTDDIDAYGRFELAVNARAPGRGSARTSRPRSRPSRRARRAQSRRHPDRGPGDTAARGVQLETGCGRSGLDRGAPGGAGLVVLDGTVTPELEAEGWAKDRIRELQELRTPPGWSVRPNRVVTRCAPRAKSGPARTAT